MNKKSIAQTMKDAGFKPLSRAQQQQNIAILTPVWIEEQNDMTTKTDAARECAEEIVDLFDLNCKLGEHGPRHNIMVDEVETIKNILAKHFPPSVPVSKLEEKRAQCKRAIHNYTQSGLRARDLNNLLEVKEKVRIWQEVLVIVEALIAEAK